MKGVTRGHPRGWCRDYHAKFVRAEHGGGRWTKLVCVNHGRRGVLTQKLDTRYHRRKAKLQLRAEEGKC